MVKESTFFLLVIMFILLVFSAFLLSRAPETPITADAILDDEENMTNNYTIEEVEEFCELDETFICGVKNILPDRDKLTLVLENIFNREYVIKSIEISGCEDTIGSFNVKRRDRIGVIMSCALEEGQVLRSNMSVYYKKAGGGPTLISTGRVVEKI